mmetsp:Transcript_2346/g.4234  ORF Transcript_2346/g.4234 Transcript_2346/m.4234 type:complete len:523 (+) Transcript_2346:180-1748(+)
MEQNNDQKHNNINESDSGGIPPPPRRSSGLKMSQSAVRPEFRFAAIDSRPPAAAGFMMSPQPVPDVNAQLNEEEVGPTRSAAGAVLYSRKSLLQEPYGITKEQHQYYRYTPKTVPFEPTPTISLEDLNRKPGPVKPVWDSPTLNKMPMNYPVERNNRHINVDECSVDDLLVRLYKGFRIMSIQAKYFNRPASAALLTTENVELYLVLWYSHDSTQFIVEIQRRRGDTIIFHHYANYILDAAAGNLDESIFNNTEGSLLYLRSTESLLRSELSRIAPETDMDKEAVVALEIVHDLLKKDRRDARQLGMEGVCIMTNARKTVLSAAILTSRAILLGDRNASAGQGLYKIILDILQKRSIGQEELMGDEYMYDSDDEQYFLDEDEEMRDYSPEYKEEMTLLFNLALNAFSHALEVVTNFGVGSEGSLTKTEDVIDHFLVQAENLTETDLLSTFLQTMQKACAKPHNAWLAAKCLRFICQASPSARERTKKYGGPQFVENAFDIGASSHAKLESECRLLHNILTTC